jgi:hypothetical protein
VVQNPEELIADFLVAVRNMGVRIGDKGLEHRCGLGPHKPYALPAGRCAVYVFSLSRSYGSRCQAGLDRVLKVGRVGPNSNARFQAQHYNPRSSVSNLAASLIGEQVVWGYLGIERLSETHVGDWIRQHTDRDDFLLPAEDNPELGYLERYIRARLGPVFEGG